MDDGTAHSHVMMMQGGAGNPSMLGMMPMLQGIPMGNPSDIRNLSTHTKAEKDAIINANMTTHTSSRRTKVRSSSKSDNAKGDEKVILLHTRVQDTFAANLVSLVSDQEAQNLQCCVTYGKPCGCIRKYILAGPQWKESSIPNLRVSSMKDKELEAIVSGDYASLGDMQVTRAKELLNILRHAAELKKEKCYVTTGTENVDGKPVKELRGMIGLGNGRKRSKKYEDFVLDKRAKLREEYCLCEKAAQKLLGYSINFLYKKLRTNPQRTSRLVATNKAERASKGPRNLIPLDQLREMANNNQSANQCCCRNCISWLVKQHFDKIVNWRKRLEGSGQRVAQEIVAEVLLVSASLDGQNSFCQNLVHWVTGCSFKKIRRVRDHLKKDPKSLPEHGLKKYWKEKGRKSKPRSEDQNKGLALKTEKMEPFSSSAQSLERFPVSYDTRGPSDPNNLNNSNNRYDNDVQYVPESVSPPPPNRTLPTGVGTMFSAELSRARHLSREGMAAYQHMQRTVSQGHNATPPQPMYMGPENGTLPGAEMGVSYPPGSFNPALQQPGGAFQENAESGFNQHDQGRYKGTMTISDGQGAAAGHHPANTPVAQPPAQGRPSHESEPPQFHAAHPAPHGGAEQGKFHPPPFIAGFADPGASFDPGQGYYFAANPGNSQEGFFPTGPIPFFLTQAQQVDPNNPDHEGNPPSQFFLLSPAALPNNADKNPDYENMKPMMMPLTPIQMYPASYFHGGSQWENKSADAQHFVFSTADPNAAHHGQHPQDQDTNYQHQGSTDGNKRSFAPGNHEQPYFPPLTPLAVMQPQNSLFSGWLAAHPPMAVPVHDNEQQKKTDPGTEQYENQQKYYSEEMPAGQASYFKAEKTQLPAMSQWASSNQNQAYSSVQQQPNQWPNQQNAHQDSKKPFVQQPSTQVATLQANQRADVVSADPKTSLRSQMPPLAPIQNATAKQELKLPNVQTFSAPLQNADSAEHDNTLPKAGGVGNRSKRFSRDRLVANIDSPGIILPPMTPLTPALTPLMVASLAAAEIRSTASDAKAENQSVSTSSEQPSEDSVFRFPPTHISRHVAALRVQGLTSPSDPKQDNASKLDKSENDSNHAANLDSQTSAEPHSSASGDTGIMVSLSNVKPVPVLSLPATCFPEDHSDSKSKCSESQSDQQLQTPTAVLHTPTHQLTPSHLSTPTHQLHTPNQALNTPTQPLHTPTQTLNTPTQVISPSSDESTPMKQLMPAPTGKKRKADTDDIENTSPKQSRSDDGSDTETRAVTAKSQFESKNKSSNSVSKVESRRKSSDTIETIEIVDDDEDNGSVSAKKATAAEKLLANYESSSKSPASDKANVVKRRPPVFTLSSATENQPPTPSSHTQLNTPVLVSSNAMFASKMNPGLLRRGSGSDRDAASTPQFFTFMPTSGFSSPMFFAHLDQFKQQAKSKAAENSSDDSSEKVKASPLKRGSMTLNLSSKSLAEDGLQTPSKIPVVTPSAIVSASLSEVPQMFNFQDVSPSYKSNITPEKRRTVSEKATTASSEKATTASEKRDSSSTDGVEITEAKKFRLPSLVVDPPSDSEENDGSSSKQKTVQNQSKPEKTDKPSSSKTPPTAARPSLHRTRSGSNKDLILSLNNVNSLEADSFAEAAISSPLNTPGIQVITPTLPGAKMSPSRRGTPRIRGRPQPIMMAPICLTPGHSTSQVATPTFFHIISPNQIPPSSPSVLMYPYPTSRSGPLSTGSIASPAFGFFPKGAPQPSGSNSASLLKSALMRKLPVFQFPPSVPSSSSASESTASDKEGSDTSSKDQERPKSVSEATSASAQNASERNRE